MPNRLKQSRSRSLLLIWAGDLWRGSRGWLEYTSRLGFSRHELGETWPQSRRSTASTDGAATCIASRIPRPSSCCQDCACTLSSLDQAAKVKDGIVCTEYGVAPCLRMQRARGRTMYRIQTSTVQPRSETSQTSQLPFLLFCFSDPTRPQNPCRGRVAIPRLMPPCLLFRAQHGGAEAMLVSPSPRSPAGFVMGP